MASIATEFLYPQSVTSCDRHTTQNIDWRRHAEERSYLLRPAGTRGRGLFAALVLPGHRSACGGRHPPHRVAAAPRGPWRRTAFRTSSPIGPNQILARAP